MSLKSNVSKFARPGVGLFLVIFLIASRADALVLVNDPDFVRQDYLQRLHFPAAWDLVNKNLSKKQIVVAVLDTGVDIDHPDLVNIIWHNDDEIPGDGVDNDHNSYIDDVYGWDFVNSVADPRPKLDDAYDQEAIHHGTVVSGIIAAETNNGIGIAGAASRVKIMALRILDGQGSGNTAVLKQALSYALDNGADIVNLSLVGTLVDPNLSSVIERAYQLGVAIVASAGNQEVQGIDLDLSPRYPVCELSPLNRVLGVAALDAANRLATFSNYGSRCIDISAPGTDFYSTVLHIDANNNFSAYYSGGWSGTSVATPLVSATVALIEQSAPNLSLDQVYRSIFSSARGLLPSEPLYYESLGAGVIDAEAAVAQALELSRQQEIDVIMAAGPGMEPTVTVKSKNNVTVAQFFAYAQAFRGGVSAVAGDVDGDRNPEIVTVPRSAGGPHVRVFDSQGHVKSQFMAYDSGFRGGLSLALGDVDADGQADIIVAPISGGPPLVKIFSYNGRFKGQFMAYAQAFRGGVLLASCDVERDGQAEIITVPFSLGGPHVRIFDARGEVKGQFMAYKTDFRGGLRLGVGDVDSDNEREIVITPFTSSDPLVYIYDLRGNEKNRFPIYSKLSDRAEASNLLLGDYSGDGQPDILTYTANKTSLRFFDFYGRLSGDYDFTLDRLTVIRGVEFSLLRL